MSKKEIDQPLTGSLNKNYLLSGPNGPLLLRVPQTNRDIVASVASQFGRLGYKGQFAIRSPQEQSSFSRNAFAAGLRVVPA